MSLPGVEVRRADASDVGEVVAVLDEAAAWLAGRRVSQWPRAFDEDWVLPDLTAGRTWLAWVAEQAAGTLTLTWEDPLWPTDGEAAYVHRLARRRSAPGLGNHLLLWVAGQAVRCGRRRLRLDCVATNEGLRMYYERLGFRHCGHVRVGGAPGQRRSAGPTTTVSLYEKKLID